jgi:hypothetical protein
LDGKTSAGEVLSSAKIGNEAAEMGGREQSRFKFAPVSEIKVLRFLISTTAMPLCCRLVYRRRKGLL